MKKTNKGFTLVELIIVIAVIGVLAAILIPVFANVIEKANVKSAFSDARNALSIYVAEKTDGENGGAVVGDGTVFYVGKAGNVYAFYYQDNGLHEGKSATETEPNQESITSLDAASGSDAEELGMDEFPDNVKIDVK